MIDKLTNTPDLDKLQDIFIQFPEIEAVYQFGSTVSGVTHQESDLDLAVIPATESLRKQKLDILTALAHQGFCNVDLVFPSNENIVLLFEIVRNNSLVYQKQDFSAGAFFSRVLRQYFDFYPYLTVQRQAYKMRILNGTA